jgi:hypothetical protein
MLASSDSKAFNSRGLYLIPLVFCEDDPFSRRYSAWPDLIFGLRVVDAAIVPGLSSARGTSIRPNDRSTKKTNC